VRTKASPPWRAGWPPLEHGHVVFCDTHPDCTREGPVKIAAETVDRIDIEGPA